MGLRGDPKPGLVLGLRESGVKGGSTCKNPCLSPEEGEGVLERGDDAVENHLLPSRKDSNDHFELTSVLRDNDHSLRPQSDQVCIIYVSYLALILLLLA